MNNVVLDVFIGLIFIYLLYSLLATVIQEIIAKWFGLRARMLQKAIRRMLEDEKPIDSGYLHHNSVVAFVATAANALGRFFLPTREGEDFIKKFYSHPTIKYLGEDRLSSKPSYLHAHSFSQTIMQILRGDTYDGRIESESSLIESQLQRNDLGINAETLRHLRLLFADSRQDAYVFKKKLEDWFDETMERSTGWYKKQTQLILAIIGYAVAASFNIDSIAIAKILMKDKKAREAMVSLAASKQESYGKILDTLTVRKVQVVTKKDSIITTTDSVIIPSIPDPFLEHTYEQLQKDNELVQGILGLNAIPSTSDSAFCKQLAAYYDSLICKATSEAQKQKLQASKKHMLSCCLDSSIQSTPYQDSEGLKILGWIITALAISLGAPFWFDLLNKFMSIRGTGPKPIAGAAYDQPAQGPVANNPVVDNNNQPIRG